MTGGLVVLAAAGAAATMLGLARCRRADRFRASPAAAGDGSGVTREPSAHSIRFVISRTAKMLTKRRAVDFCHVATAICPPARQS